MRRIAWIGLVAVAAAIAIWWWRGRTRAIEPRQPNPTATTPQDGSSGGAGARPVSKVTKVSPEERHAFADRIAAAQAARARAGGGAIHAPPRPSLPDGSDAPSNDAERIQPYAMDALKAAIPYLEACYKTHGKEAPGLVAVAQMTLTADPDIGTVIDADQITDDQHRPIPKDLDECLRGTMLTLELPPLGDGEKFRVEYSFRFDDDSPKSAR